MICNYFFDEAHAFSVNAHTKEVLRTKEHVLGEYVTGEYFEQLVVVGDSSSDMWLAEAFDATAYLYAHPGYAFRSSGGDYHIHDLREVLREAK